MSEKEKRDCRSDCRDILYYEISELTCSMVGITISLGGAHYANAEFAYKAVN